MPFADQIQMGSNVAGLMRPGLALDPEPPGLLPGERPLEPPITPSGTPPAPPPLPSLPPATPIPADPGTGRE